MTTVVTSSNRSYHMCRNSALSSGDGRSDPGYFGKTPRPSRVMYTFAVIFRTRRPPTSLRDRHLGPNPRPAGLNTAIRHREHRQPEPADQRDGRGRERRDPRRAAEGDRDRREQQAQDAKPQLGAKATAAEEPDR